MANWKEAAKKSLENRQYVPPEKRVYELGTDSKYFGKISYNAKKAIENNTLDSYLPRNAEEKTVLDEYRKQLTIPFTIEIDGETKNFGNISYDAWNAINNNTLDNYKFKNNDEKKVFDAYTTFAENYAKKQREPKTLGQGLFHSIGYTAEKIGAGAVDGLSDAGKFLLAGGAKLLSLPTWGSVKEGLNKTAEYIINDKTVGDVWNNSIESRYRVPDWYRESFGNAVFNIGSLAPSIAAEVVTYSASPMLELQLAGSAAKVGIKGTIKSAAKNLSTKLAKPKVSDVVFGLGAAGSAAEAGYKQSGDVGKALNYGILNGLGEVATEKLFGGIGGTGIGADELIDLSKINGISKLASNKYGKKVLDIAFEGVEEMIMADAEPWFQKLTVNPNAEINHAFQSKFWKDRGEAFAQGVLLSGLMNAGTFAINKTANTINKTKAINVVNTATNGINALLQNDADKLTPLKLNASIDDIKQRQNEIGVFTMAYADIMVDELVKNNPEKFSSVEKISVGDKFKDTKTGYTITVIGRDAKNTTVGIDTGVNTITKQFTNKQADNFVESEQLVEVETPTSKTTPTVKTPTVEATPTVENTVVAKNATTENKVVDDYESEADELLNTDMTEDETPAETPIVEATAPKVEEAKPSKPKSITLTQSGNTYEAYGEDARIIADSLELETAKQVVNGVETDSIKFPAEFLDGLVDELGGDYNFVTTNKATTEKSSATETETKPESNESFATLFSEKLNSGDVSSLGLKKVTLEFGDNNFITIATSENGKFYLKDIGNNKYEIYPSKEISQRAYDGVFNKWFDIQRNKGDVVSVIEPAVLFDNKTSGRYDLLSKGQVVVDSIIKKSEAKNEPTPKEDVSGNKETPTTKTKPTKANNEVEETTTEAKTQSVAEETKADDTQLPEALKRDESGKIRFEQMDIDYSNNSMRKGQFNTINTGWKSQTVDGFICGKYGVHKSDITGKYAVTLLQSGMTVNSFDKVTEAKKVATYLNNLSFNDVSYNKMLSGSYAIERTDEFQSYLSEVKKILDNKEYDKSKPVATEIKDGKVPFNTKSGLIDYVKAHIGDKVKATFNNGNSEVRTLYAISNTSLRTKRPDGSVVTSELKGVEYNDNGIHIDFKNGVAVTFDFVNVVETELSKSKTENNLDNNLDNKAKESISDTQKDDVNEKVYELVKKARNSKTVDTKSLEEIRDYYGNYLYEEALDRVLAENQADELIGKAKELKSLMEEDANEVLKNQPESDTMEAKETDNTSSKSEGTKKIADYVAKKLEKGEKITALELSKVATESFGGTMSNNVFTVKDAYDAMELGVNQHILSMKDVSAEKMLELLELLPTQTKRTEDQVKFQQFSTPPSIAYLANYTANVNAKDVMLEPSAGIGGIAAFAKKDGAKVYVNELDNRRLEVLKNMPFDGFYNEDAEQLNNILGGEIEPTVIVMNPPFSSSSERNMKNTKIGAKHIEQALKILAPNGRLVAIVGKGMADGEPAFRTWWKDIKSQYNVRANIGINGKNYNKYGTNFDIQMLVIDKNGTTTDTVTGYVDTLQELQEKLGGIRDERPAIDYSGNEQRTPATTRTEVAPKGKTADNGNSVVPDTSSVADKGKSTDKRGTSGKSTVQDIQSTDAEHGKSSSTTSESADVVDNGQSVDERGKLEGNAELQDNGRTDISDSGQHSEQPDVDTSNRNSGNGQNDVRVQRPKRTELTDSIFEQYQTQPLKVKNAQPHPAKVSESAAMSAIEPPPITYKPNLPKDIVEKGVVSDVQLEAISYAGQSHSQTLPNGTTRGFFLGDGTGIGKGRTIAGMMLDNYNQGRKKAVWVTLNSSLVNDAKRDVKALFGSSDLVTQFVGGNKADSVLNTDEAIMVISYSSLSTGFENKDSNFEKLVNWLGKDFDGLIVFDEAHKMGNATDTKGTRGMKKASKTGIAGIALQDALPKAKIVYSSATGATEVENLRYAERLGLWGEGTPFIKGDDFVSKIKAGGLAAMELIARDMKAMGVYLSRNISYDDVQYDKITHNLTAQQTKIYDELASSWQIVLQNINQALETTNQGKDGHARGRALGAFWSSQQRFFNQILTSMQVPSVIADIEKQLADGKSCVIQLVSTNESAQNQEFERLKSEKLDLDEFDLTPKQVLMSMVENSFPVQQYETYRDDNGNVKSQAVYDSKGNPVLNREAVAQRDELLSKLGSIKVPSSPIDMIINHFGTDMVAENTGRARRVIQKDGKTIEEKIGSKKDADVDAFQNGNKRIIIFSKAGGTGKSYHADKTAKNQQQRVHYLLEAGWQADNAVQGFGRSHRSNQVSAPIFKLVTTNLKGQMRFISTIAKRLDQLGAMTKGQRQAGGQGMFSASDNLENSFAADVLAGFYKDLLSNKVEGIDDGMSILEKLGLKNKILDEYGRIIPTASELREVNKFLNRILSLESAEQNTVFEGYSHRLQEATENAMQAGTLDKGLENYKADKITLNEVQDIKEDERSGAKTKYYNLTAEHKVQVRKFADVPTDNKSFVGFYQNKNTGALRAVFQTSSTTDKDGNVVSNYKLMGQTTKAEYIPQNRFYGNWTQLNEADVENLWNEEVSKLPSHRQENLHLISGVVLPVWDKLPTENVRIYRVLTSDGEMLIGRVIPENMIDQTLKRLGSSRTKEKIATKDLIDGIKNGNTVLLDNGWKIVQRKVSGENRIEIAGASYEYHDLLKNKGVFAERIQYFTRYFIPADVNTEQVLDEVLKISPVSIVETPNYSYSLESGDNNETRNGLLFGNSDRGNNESTRKQAKRISEFKQKLEGKTEAERRSFAKELLAKGQTEKITTNDGKHQFDVVKPEAYNDDMLSIVEEGKANGKDVGFFVGHGKFKFSDLKIDAIEQGNRILLRYDGTFSPQTLMKHEDVHIEWDTPEMQKAKDIILNDLSEAEKNKILAEDRYKQYMAFYNGNKDKVLQEFVADVFAGMNEHSSQYVDLVVDYWYDGKVVDNYKVSEYTESIDTGGTNEDVLNNIGFGENLSVLSDDYTERALPEGSMINEYHKDLNSYEWWQYYQHVNNYDWDAELRKGTFDFYTIIGNKLIKSNYSKGKPSVLKIYTVNSVELLPYEEGVIYDNDTKEILDKLTKAKESLHKGTDDNFRMSITEQGKDDGRIVNNDGKQFDSTSNYEVPERESGTVADIHYSFSVDNDTEQITPERKKEILEQYERDRVGIEKPTQKQLWGERAEWIAHNVSRVFPNIPERGERGTFFAEFRKNMIQWNGLSSTADFMVKDKLNEMTKGLTPDEFKTFGELVYFLDLQEEAQMQKDHGYDEILLPNEITPDEVNAIVEMINEEATENVKNALAKRQQIWDDLKEQYIALNQHIGFNTDEKFKRKNYYHHQVIEYMNSGSKGTGGREINIKAGRGWLKERQGSTKAINTDFLAVEHKAMLQMQYDIYVAQILGKTKDRYDIKPQLEKQAFNNNKKLLNDIIIKEATDENGEILVDRNGKPDSETYREQQSYNRGIMRGFSGLFELAELGALPTFNGQYSNAVNALIRQNLNAPGLYNYVARLASMELSENATNEEHQAQISAKTVLKYTSQKKAWVKEVLGSDYQTWETLAKSMSDTHSIHQPRRGNYFYTKEVLNEDAFDKAFNDMIVGLVAGENGIDTTEDIKKLFGQYSETIRQIGAAYEQWVLPNEIVTTMQEVGNPKAVSEGQKMARGIMSAWKGAATSVNPFRTVKFGIRNMAGDLDAVIAGNPKVLKYSKQATKEIYQAMRHKKYSDSFMEFVERGGYTSMIFANEMDAEMQEKVFSHLLEKTGLKGKNILEIPASIVKGYQNGVESAHNFREAILRYSAYLYYKEAINRNGGTVKDYVASNRYIVKGLESVEDKAYQLSKDLLGAYDEVGKMGQTLRRYWVPFYSFTETNMKRYYRLFENVIMSDDNIPKKAGKLLLKSLMVNLFGLLLIAWNKLVMKDEDDKLPTSARNVPHLTLGTIGDNVYAFRQLGSFSEILEWIGLEDYKWESADEPFKEAVNKVYGMLNPGFKYLFELPSGMNSYPDVFKPSPIRDRWEYLANSWGVAELYNEISGKPTKGIGEILKSGITYSYDIEESAYNEIRSLKYAFQGKDDGTTYKPNKKSNALYYMKKAVKYKDKETALKYFDEYFENGGTAKGITQSFSTLNPMYGYTGKETIKKGEEFIATLTPEEKEKLKIAQDYYEKELMLPANVSSRLGKKNITENEAKNLLKNYINAMCK